MKYDVDYFLNKFQAIPEVRWTTGKFVRGNKRCAGGHCGMGKQPKQTEEYTHLERLFALLSVSSVTAEKMYCIVPHINDGQTNEYQQPTPKQRIMAALYDIKKLQKQKKKQRTKTVYVSVPVSITEQAKELIIN